MKAEERVFNLRLLRIYDLRIFDFINRKWKKSFFSCFPYISSINLQPSQLNGSIQKSQLNRPNHNHRHTYAHKTSW